MKKKDMWVPVAILLMAVCVSSCQISDQELGEDLLPSGDNVFLFHDTVFDISAYMITGEPFESSELAIDVTRKLLVGEMTDTITGFSRATALTQFSTNPSFRSGPNMEIDSVVLSLYMEDYIGDMDQEFTIRVYELTERIYRDSVYFSDYDTEGRFDPVPMVEQTVIPDNGITLQLLINDQDFRNKFLALEDTTLTRNDSIFKDYFNGFFITAEPQSEKGTMARIGFSNEATILSVKYSSDSTDVDTTAEREFAWINFPIDELFCQKINVFEHDYSGTYLAGILDDSTARSPYCYVQGIGGVNTRLSFTSLEEWMAKTPVAINSATLVFEAVPEDESGIPYDDLPRRLMMGTILEDGFYEPVYDYWVLLNNQASSRFGGYKKAESDGLFFDTVYNYRFQMPLHYQALIDSEKEENDFILQVDDGNVNPRIVKLWSNLPGNSGRIRLEIVYLRLDTDN